MACYLHDISMVTFPDLNAIHEETYECNKIYSDFVIKAREKLQSTNLCKSSVKNMLKEFYMRMDAFYENLVRASHAKNSASEIRKKSELEFIDDALREIVAEISEAHGASVNDIYIKRNRLQRQKYGVRNLRKLF